MWRTSRYVCVCATRTLVSLYCCITVVGSPLSRCFVMDFAVCFVFISRIHSFFLCAEKVFCFFPRLDSIFTLTLTGMMAFEEAHGIRGITLLCCPLWIS